MKTTLIVMLMVLLGISIKGQELPKIVSPPPNAASLAQYVDVPVSMYTGLPEISIPLYTISEGKLKVPISLSYHARGVKLAEIATSYGMGWSLNAGGAVTRQVRGNADDSTIGYLSQSYYDDFKTNPITRQNAYAAEINGDFDRMPDQFYFNFLGISGKFIYDRITHEPILETFDDLKIETIGDPSQNIEGFIITDTNGTKYRFGKSSDSSIAIDNTINLKDYSFNYNNGISENVSQAPSINNSWYLMEVVGLNGDTMAFRYESEASTTFQINEEVAEKVGNDYVKTCYFSETLNYQQKISKIVFSQGEVDFIYNTPREDLSGYSGSTPQALTQIVVTNNNGVRVKKYEFDYFHSQSLSSANSLQFFNINAPEAKKRLFLSSIKEQGRNDDYLPPFEFIYNDTEVLPSRFSSAHDKWGYYNGENNGDFSVFAQDLSEIGGTTIDTVKVQTGILNKINYPTGGSVEYIYESNRGVFPAHLEGHVAFPQNNPTNEKTVVLDKDPIYYNSQTHEYSIPFTISADVVETHPNGTATLETTVFLEDVDCTDVENSECDYMVRIYHENGIQVHTVLHKTTLYTQISPGNYVLKVIPTDAALEDPTDGLDNFGVQLRWLEYSENEREIIYTGGNRIKRTILRNGMGQSIERNYNYSFSDGSTSGKVFALPSYFGYGTVTFQDGSELTVYHHVMYRPANKLTLEQGNHGGYAKVTEYIGNNNNNIGKNEYSFTTFYDGGFYYSPPYHLPNSNERFRGKPTRITNYKFESGTYEKVKEIYNTYDYESNSSPRTTKEVELIVFGNVGNLYFDGNFNPTTAHNDYKVFYLRYGVNDLIISSTTDYFDTGNAEMLTEYKYDYDKHYQISRTINTDSKGKNRITTSIYPQSKSTALTTAEQLMKEHNQFEVIESSVYLDHNYDGVGDNEELLNKTSYKYRNWSGQMVLPETIEIQKANNITEHRLIYQAYDERGNPVQVSKPDGPIISYLYGYDKQYPIAKIENASYEKIKSALNLSEISEVMSLDENQMDLINGLREIAVMSNTMITTFSYDPLIGITKITDFKGDSTIYEYDSFNRLEVVRDHMNNKLEDYKYHYKLQPTN